MGQYHRLVNLDKKEYVHPHNVGDGMKLLEWSEHGMLSAMQILLAVSNGRGGGDLPNDNVVGRWGGNRIAIIGDYAEEEDIKIRGINAKTVYAKCCSEADKDWMDISDLVVPMLEKIGDFTLSRKDGWRQRTPNKGKVVTS